MKWVAAVVGLWRRAVILLILSIVATSPLRADSLDEVVDGFQRRGGILRHGHYVCGDFRAVKLPATATMEEVGRERLTKSVLREGLVKLGALRDERSILSPEDLGRSWTFARFDSDKGDQIVVIRPVGTGTWSVGVFPVDDPAQVAWKKGGLRGWAGYLVAEWLAEPMGNGVQWPHPFWPPPMLVYLGITGMFLFLLAFSCFWWRPWTVAVLALWALAPVAVGGGWMLWLQYYLRGGWPMIGSEDPASIYDRVGTSWERGFWFSAVLVVCGLVRFAPLVRVRRKSGLAKLGEMGVAVTLLLSAGGLLRAEEAPKITSDHPTVVLYDESVIYVATGGSTDAPPDSFGLPPWHRTGNRQYTWHVTTSEPREDGVLPKVEEDGEITATGTMVFASQEPGNWSITVSLQEEWQDSNEGEPLTVFWPK